MSNDGVDNGRRRFLLWSTSAVGAVGAVGIAVPFVQSWNPSARAQAAGAPVEVDVSKLKPGQAIKTEWRGKPIFVIRRSAADVSNLEKIGNLLKDPESSNPAQQPSYVGKVTRSIKDDVMVVVGICTHLGCVPQQKEQVEPAIGGGFFCPCHGSKFDLAGRVLAGVPASDNLEVPPYTYLSDSVILIGVDKGAA